MAAHTAGVVEWMPRVRKWPYRTSVCQVSAVTFLPFPREPHDAVDRLLLPLPAEIDFCNASDVRELVLCAALAASDRPRVLVLDLTATRFMDSQGARLIGEVRRLLYPGTRVHVVARPDGVAGRVIELTGLRRDVPVYDSVTEAMTVEVC